MSFISKWRNLYGKEIDLYPWQREAIWQLGGRTGLVSAPTGSGKTIVAYRWAGLETPWCANRVIFTAPIKALSNERYLELRRVLGEEGVGILTGDVARNAGAPVLCMTQEVYANAFCELPEQRVVIDEIHYMIHNPDRARAYAEGIARTHPQSQLLFLSATVQTRSLARYLERLCQRPLVVVEHCERPVPMEYLENPVRVEEVLFDLAPTLLFVFSYRGVMELARWLRRRAEELGVEVDRAAVRALAREYLLRNRRLWELIQGGIGIYSGGLLYKEKLLVERLAREGLLRAVVATDALSLGINLPVRTVLFAQLARPTLGPLSKMEFLQMAGRAGRPNLQEVGFVGYFPTPFEQRGYNTGELYEELRRKPLENLCVRPFPSMRRVLLGASIEEELQAIESYSFPKLNRRELHALRQEIEFALKRIDLARSQLKLLGISPERFDRLIREIYFDEFSVTENLAFVQTLLLEGKLDARKEAWRVMQEKGMDGEILKKLLQLRRFLKSLPKGKVVALGVLDRIVGELDEFVLHPERLDCVSQMVPSFG
ncbi:DEAD/DEAH box helicase [Candidatus Methylacidithermus pantelleriae]|uniref:Helicase domain protein n=1 Tax=Candidatus Methylacidithermus pantelleriae TaxID=2744239 RepID=A0A8J2BQ63_9BACT|nr:DEAD/DEAH box helicase [Candidatus Methylacidithermus pantelleriae]CAF0702722.1 Helicase domain protein [Candidatus Methylacidithermus pantelleriae]